MSTVKFTFDPNFGTYWCSEPGKHDGEYVRVPDDDGVPIANAIWLADRGFRATVLDDWFQADLVRDEFTLTLLPEATFFTQREDEDADCVQLPAVRTRGDLRKLCSALGVPLKEGL